MDENPYKSPGEEAAKRAPAQWGTAEWALFVIGTTGWLLSLSWLLLYVLSRLGVVSI
jgi:hypothetical protein